MTYITLTNDMSLLVTQSTPIYRGDNMSSAITFLLPLTVDKIDLATATVFLSYIRDDGEPDMVILNRLTEKYNQSYYQYVLPVTCKLSKYPGQINMWLQICDDNKTCRPSIKKSGECFIRIHESKNMDSLVGDRHLTAVYQLLKKCDKLSEDTSTDCTWEDIGDDSDNEWGEIENPDYDTSDVWEDM